MFKYVIVMCLFILSACSRHSVGPNYNQGKSHNQNKMNRSGIVYREDARMKNKMNKVRSKASMNKKYKHKKYKKLVK